MVLDKAQNGVIRRALISVSEKKGLIDFALALVARGFEVVASGGTARALRAGGVAVCPVEQLTNTPSLFGGRVKTLHPAIHGGILARQDVESDLDDLRAYQLTTFGVVVCNLYPFEAAVAALSNDKGLTEHIDIGGVTLLRAAAKNHRWVLPICAPEDYTWLIEEIDRDGGPSLRVRRALALKAFRETARHDAAIIRWLSKDEDAVEG